jgi:hypothetical protein
MGSSSWQPTPVAYVAVARKLLTYLNSLLRPAHVADLPVS